MLITGYQLKEAIKMATLELGAVKTQFDESLYAFEEEEKQSPVDVAKATHALETKIAKLQTAQSEYNLAVELEVLGEKMPLETAVKLVGGAGRMSKLWRVAAQGSVRDRWARKQQVVRREGDEVAKDTISKADALLKSKEAEKLASALRSAIAVGNTAKIGIAWLDESLLG